MVLFRANDLFLSMGIGWAVYGTLNLLTRPNRKDRDTFFALLVLACFTLPVIDNLVKPSPEWRALLVPFFLITRNTYFLAGPALWLYSGALLKQHPIRRQIILLHSLPFIVWVIIALLSGESFNPRPMAGPLHPNRLPFPGPHLSISGGIPTRPDSIPAFLRDVGALLSPLIYGILVSRRIATHSRQIPEYYSSKTLRNTLSWLLILTLALIGLYAVLLTFMFVRLTGNSVPNLSPTLRSIPPVLFIFYFAYFSREQQIPEDTKADFKPEKYKNSTVETGIVERIYSELLIMMEKQKPFLNPDLTLDDLAAELNVSKHHLSQVINVKTEGNFFSFINRFRVEEFKTALETDRFPHHTLVAVAFESGFRSSSAFYSMFKKTTGLTPKAYAESLP